MTDTLIDDLKEAVRRLEAGEEVAGDELARLVSAITALEMEEGGPYALLPGGGPEELDKGLNLLVAYFLALCDVDLPKLDAFLEKHSEEKASAVLSEEELHSLEEKVALLRFGVGKVQAARDEDEEKMMTLIMEKFEERFSGFPLEMKERAGKATERTIRGNPDKQMSLMAYYTRKALGEKGNAISDDVVADMGLANIFFWTAFIIYDDLWDGDETADPKLLPIANVFARHYIDHFCGLFPKEDGFSGFVNRVMDKLDAANAWETEYCRMEICGEKVLIPEMLPDYGDHDVKYRPASGHILGPLAILAQTGAETGDLRNFISYFRHYLIAMQLNDDAHDWEEDLRRGRISTMVALLIRDMKEKGWAKPEIDLAADLPSVREIFWFTTLPKYAELAIAHSNFAQKALDAIDMFEDKKPLSRFPERTESVAREALRERKKSIDFLEAFGK